MSKTRAITPTTARRLAISAQHLDRTPAALNPDTMYEVVRQIGCVQLDPISAVARSHQLVLFSRLGRYDLVHLDHLTWNERRLFEYWAHAASIVLTEDFPIHHSLMRTYLTRESEWTQRTRQWLADNEHLKQHILESIRERGAMLSRDFEDSARADWQSSGWTSGRNVNQMLDYLWTAGALVVAGRKGGQKLWDLAERWLPEWTPREILPDDERVSLATQKALRALGVATPKHITQHFTRGRYPNLDSILTALEREKRIERVTIANGNGGAWAGDWYVHADHVRLLEQIEANEWSGRTTLLSPFDNLICDRTRTEKMWDFYFRIEIYVPKAKREYGYYVLPILHGDTLIGRIDPTMNRKTKTLEVHNVYAEPTAPLDDTTGRAVANAISELAAFLGAKTITIGNLPDGWRAALGSL